MKKGGSSLPSSRLLDICAHTVECLSQTFSLPSLPALLVWVKTRFGKKGILRQYTLITSEASAPIDCNLHSSYMAMATQIDACEAQVSKGRGFEIDDIVVVQVESTLHRVAKAHLVRWSQMFRDMFALPQGPESEGSSESNPIVLSGCKNADFEAFLDLIVTPRSLARNLTQCQWEAILRLATIWDMPQVSTLFVERSHPSQELCHIHQLRSMATISLSHSNLSAYCKIRLGKTYKVASWLMEGYTNLGRGTYDNLDDLAAQLDWETAARIAHVAYLTSERAKEVPFTIPSSSVNCPGCDEAYTHSNSPWMSESLRVDPLATGKQMYVHRSELESVLALHWIPGKEGERAEWDCLHRRRCVIQNPPESGFEFATLTGSINELVVDNADIVQEVFADELRDTY
ncbi:hypothetical protein NMY22_g2678 [Coprinellus aureogranulatus]|nr:hypothetical protein NMY22_g2678 [Coprinellus aureogranulatus]